jgi:hypothetical protein
VLEIVPRLRCASHFPHAGFYRLCTEVRGTKKINDMRTLVDLLNNDHGYARIYADREGFSYELNTYLPKPIADLFERMSGYASATEASEAAKRELMAAHQLPKLRSRSYRSLRSAR